MYLYGIVMMSLFAMACASTPHPQAYFKPYYKMLKKGKKKKSLYRNFNQILEVQAVLLSQELERNQVEQRRQMFKYSPTELEDELRQGHENNTKNTRFFLSVYTHKFSLNDLHLSKGFWRVFLNVNEHSVEGKVKSLKKVLTELQVLYPFHTRWHRGYVVTFPIPLQDIHGKEIYLHVHSLLGNVKMAFNH